mmetsp:Transcript_17189/g.30013  ORF Transcript_17189/g.30013 Transcript_17189/m.30013 type:complete len:182 (-) Transcript_17189:68-613(-)
MSDWISPPCIDTIICFFYLARIKPNPLAIFRHSTLLGSSRRSGFLLTSNKAKSIALISKKNCRKSRRSPLQKHCPNKSPLFPQSIMTNPVSTTPPVDKQPMEYPQRAVGADKARAHYKEALEYKKIPTVQPYHMGYLFKLHNIRLHPERISQLKQYEAKTYQFLEMFLNLSRMPLKILKRR